MLTDVVEIVAADGVRLPAGYLAASGPAPEGLTGIDAVVLNPGTSGSFYHQPLFGMAAVFAEHGIPALSLSTRGHDIVWRDQANARYLGAAYEQIEDCVLDFAAAFSFLAERGHQRILLLGHSLGGVKVLYYGAHAEDPRLAAIVSLSGPRWSGRYYAASERAADFARNLTRAQALVDAGQGDQLIELDFPIGPSLRTAAGYVHKYGGEIYNFETWCDRIRVPILRVVGSGETGVVQRGVSEDLMRLAVNSPNRRAVTLPGAGHAYTPAEAREIVGMVIGWARDSVEC